MSILATKKSGGGL
jgi:hypothetical protein